MKNKNRSFLVDLSVVVSKFIIVVSLSFIIAIAVFEEQKDDMFFQVMNYFNALYDAEIDEYKHGLGIIDKDDVNPNNHSLVTNISDEKKKSRDLSKDILEVCINKHMAPDIKDQTVEQFKAAEKCVGQQIKDAIIIGEVYIKEAELQPEGFMKMALKTIIGNCVKENTIDDGLTDYSETLQCIKTDLKDLGDAIDKQALKLRKQKGDAI